MGTKCMHFFPRTKMSLSQMKTVLLNKNKELVNYSMLGQDIKIVVN